MVACTLFSSESHTMIRMYKLEVLAVAGHALVCMKKATINFLCLLSSCNFGFNIAVFLTLFFLQHKRNYMTLNCKTLHSAGLR